MVENKGELATNPKKTKNRRNWGLKLARKGRD
jgi:hypothetical protein